jgi:hypothetical protein
VALVRTDVSEELSASIIRVTRIGELGTLATTSNQHTLKSYISSVYLILEAALELVVYLASNRNKYLKQKNNVSGEQSAAYS